MSAFPDMPLLPERFIVRGEIDRGGMGAIWRVIDRQFDRPLAVKVMLPKHVSDAHAVERFNREAQLTGALQHPAIPPVVERGLLADGSPYLSMKFVEGETLAKVLAKRPGDGSDLPGLLGVFEQVAQAVGYAHSQGVIHRDLKPANIMVGAFGDVQVMDWGMAKQIGGLEPGEPVYIDGRTDVPFDLEGTITFIKDDRGVDSDTDSPAEGSTLTVAGQVLGTLAYMPPEQARGDIKNLDARADVFALGGILCKLLTGRPPYAGADQMTLYRNVVEGNLAKAFSALDSCDADPELVTLCKECLSRTADNRPKDASTVAERVRLYDEATRERLEAERAERAASEVREIEAKKRRRVQLTFAVVALAFLLLAVCAALWYQQREADRRITQAAEASRIEAEQLARQSQARQDITRALEQVPALEAQFLFAAASTLLRQAESQLDNLPDGDDLAERVDQQQRNLRFVRESDRIRLQKSHVTNDSFAKQFANGPDGAYANAFREHGLDLLEGDLENLSRKLRDSNGVDLLISAIDDWLVDESENVELRSRLSELANSADTDKTRIALRKAIKQPQDILKIIEQAQGPLSPKLAELAAHNLLHGERPAVAEAAHVLFQSLNSHPRDFWLHFDLATWELGLTDEARSAHCRAAIAIRPQSAAAYNNLGALFQEQGKLRDAEWAYRKTLALNPQFFKAHTNLAAILYKQQDLVQAESLLRKAIELDPQNGAAYGNLGRALYDQGKLAEAKAAYASAIEFDPMSAQAHFNLATVLAQLQAYSDAEVRYRMAMELDPTHADAISALFFLLSRQGKSVEAEAIGRQLVKLDAAKAKDYILLGLLLRDRGEVEEAKKAFSRAIDVEPENVDGYFLLGTLHRRQHEYDEAEAVYRKAVTLDGSNKTRAMAHCNLGLLLMRRSNRFDEAVALLERGNTLGKQDKSWRYPSDEWLAKAKLLQERANQVLAIRAGGKVPKASPETLELARVAFPRLSRPGVAMRLYEVVLSSSAVPADVLRNARPRAAMAALAASELPAEDPTIPPAYRQKALIWLRESLPKASDEARREWLTALEFASVRGDRLKLLPDSEQRDWRQFWSDVR